MAIYAIGDLQGCFEPLRRLLDKIAFDPAADTLWFAGDLVNRGPESLEALRFVRALGDSAVSVLGNHDLHLLAVVYGPHQPKKKDTLDAILAAPDREELLQWLLHRPLLHHDPEHATAMVHAGIHPHWSLEQARAYAGELEGMLRGSHAGDYFAGMYGNHPNRWLESHGGVDRLRVITNCFTRMRFVSAKGELDMKSKGPPGSQPKGLIPWFELPGRAAADTRIVFGHWAALGLHHGDNVVALDSGCVWGNHLTALRIDRPHEARETVSVECS